MANTALCLGVPNIRGTPSTVTCNGPSTPKSSPFCAIGSILTPPRREDTTSPEMAPRPSRHPAQSRPRQELSENPSRRPPESGVSSHGRISPERTRPSAEGKDMTIELAPVEEQDSHRPPGPPTGPPPDVWVYKGRAYDLSDWIAKHPGGAFFIGR